MCGRTITVTGRGTVHVVPDVTRVQITIKGLRQEYSDCYELAKENNQMLSRIMEGLGLDLKLPKTTNLDIDKHEHNVYDKFGHFDHSEFDGYMLSQHIKIDLGMNTELLGKLVQSVGRNLTDAEISIGYTVKDSRPAQIRMLEKAVKDAKEKAGVMAAAADCELGDVASINYSWQELNVYSQAREIHNCEEAKACLSDSLDITPDDLAASDDVTVVWTLKD